MVCGMCVLCFGKWHFCCEESIEERERSVTYEYTNKAPRKQTPPPPTISISSAWHIFLLWLFRFSHLSRVSLAFLSSPFLFLFPLFFFSAPFFLLPPLYIPRFSEGRISHSHLWSRSLVLPLLFRFSSSSTCLFVSFVLLDCSLFLGMTKNGDRHTQILLFDGYT